GLGVMAVLFTTMDRSARDVADGEAMVAASDSAGGDHTTSLQENAKGASAAAGSASDVVEATPMASNDMENTDEHPGMASELDLEGILPIDHVIEHAEHLAGEQDIVRGVILTQCIVGCRFSITDDTGVLNVELEDDALDNTLAQGSVGKIVEVRGVLSESAPPILIVRDPTAWEYAD
ncbi:MAG: hypothetical protein JSW65_00575, partial [Candidatus Bipolaricaulota bacterium]